MSLRFHWMLPKGGEVRDIGAQTPLEAARYRIESIRPGSLAPRPDMDGWTRFAACAEDAGIDSILISFSRYEPEPINVACAMGLATRKLSFIVATRSGLMQPTAFVQQINTLSALVDGRVSVNIVAGSSTGEQHGYGDFLAHDERYARAEEFLGVCNAFWRSRGEADFAGRYYQIEKAKLHTPFVSRRRGEDDSRPEIYVSGHSEESQRLAVSQGTCWLRAADNPESLRATVGRMRQHGIEVCLRLCVLCRLTREEAISVAESLLPADKRETIIAVKNDSQMYRERAAAQWLTRSLWTGLVPHYGPVWTTLLGTPAEIAETFLQWRSIGITQFILSGWPEIDEVVRFGRDVVPLIREAEGLQESMAS